MAGAGATGGKLDCGILVFVAAAPACTGVCCMPGWYRAIFKYLDAREDPLSLWPELSRWTPCSGGKAPRAFGVFSLLPGKLTLPLRVFGPLFGSLPLVLFKLFSRKFPAHPPCFCAGCTAGGSSCRFAPEGGLGGWPPCWFLSMERFNSLFEFGLAI
jgi:hypothetical protein